MLNAKPAPLSIGFSDRHSWLSKIIMSDVTDRPNGAGDDRPNGATRRVFFWVSGLVKNSLKDPFCQALFS
jgi:hypothetical protein